MHALYLRCYEAVSWHQPRLGVFGNQHFANVPGMAEWANNAWGTLTGKAIPKRPSPLATPIKSQGFLNDASKFNAMHFLETWLG